VTEAFSEGGDRRHFAPKNGLMRESAAEQDKDRLPGRWHRRHFQAGTTSKASAQRLCGPGGVSGRSAMASTFPHCFCEIKAVLPSFDPQLRSFAFAPRIRV